MTNLENKTEHDPKVHVQNTPNKKDGRVIAGLVLGITLLLLSLIVFTVDTTEYAVVTQFGNPVAVIREPGLNVKLPEPIQAVQRLDKRIQVYQTDSLELLTLDKKVSPLITTEPGG